MLSSPISTLIIHVNDDDKEFEKLNISIAEWVKCNI